MFHLNKIKKSLDTRSTYRSSVSTWTPQRLGIHDDARLKYLYLASKVAITAVPLETGCISEPFTVRLVIVFLL